MKYFVKYISIILLVILTAVDLGLTTEFGICIFYTIDDMSSSSGELQILSGIGGSLMIVLYAMLMIVFLAEAAVKIVLHILSLKKASYGFYMIFSVSGIMECIINVVIMLFLGIPLIINCPHYDLDDYTVSEWIFVLIGIYFFTGFFSLLDLLSANQCRKDKCR